MSYQYKLSNTFIDTHNHTTSVIANQEMKLHVVTNHSAEVMKVSPKQNLRRDVMAGLCFFQKTEAQRNVMKAVEDKLEKASLLRELVRPSEELRKVDLQQMNEIHHVTKGSQFLEIHNTSFPLLSSTKSNDGDNSTSTLTDSDSNSLADFTDDDTTSTSFASIPESVNISNSLQSPSKTSNEQNNSSNLLRTYKSYTHHHSCKSFEEFVVKTVERQKRRYERGICKQNNTSLFSCTDKINHDYTLVWRHYERLKKVPLVNNNQSSRTDLESNLEPCSSNESKENKNTTAIDDVDVHLYAASCIFQQFLNVIDILYVADKVFAKPTDDTTVPRSPLQVIYGDMEKYILTQLSLLLSDMKRITPRQAAKLLSWYNKFLQHIHDNNHTKIIKPSSLWKTDMKKLFDRYLQCGVRHEMQTLLECIDHDLYAGFNVGIDCDLRQTKSGTLATSFPEEIIYVIELQIQIATEYLCNKEYIIDVLKVCYEELSIFLCNKMINIGSRWRSDSINIMRYCSIINDSTRLSELLKEYTTKFLLNYEKSNNLTTENHHTILDKVANVENELTDLSMHAMNYLCRYIALRLECSDALLSSVGQSSWELDDGCHMMRRVVSFLCETLADIEVWLQSSDYFFPKMVKKCFQLTIQAYVQIFYQATMKRGIGNSLQVSNQLKQDYFHLATFFNTSRLFDNSDARISCLGSNQDVNTQLLVILSMSRLIDPTMSPADLSDDTRNLMENVHVAVSPTTNTAVDKVVWSQLGNATAVLHIAGLREKNDKATSMKWIQNLVNAEKVIHEDKHLMSPSSKSSVDVKWLIQLPDLLQSPHVYKVRCTSDNDDTLKAFSSVGYMSEYIQVLKELLQTKGYKRQFQMYMARKTKQQETPLRPTTTDNRRTAVTTDDKNLSSASAKNHSRGSISGYVGEMLLKRPVYTKSEKLTVNIA